MKTKTKAIYLFPLALIVMATAMPFVASAAIKSNVWSPDILTGPLISCTGANTAGGTDSKNCQDLCDLVSTVANVIYFGIGVVIWIIAPIMIAWTGLSFMFGRGDPGAVTAARDRALRVVLGLFIVLCAYLIVFTFVKVLNIAGVGGFSNPTCTISQ